MKTKIAIHFIAVALSLVGGPAVQAQYPVHDPIHTMQTIAGYTKQLEEWKKQYKQMTQLNKVNKLVADYQKQLNDLIGDPLAAAKALVDAKQVVERLAKFDKIEGISNLEAEIAGLEDTLGALTTKPEIFGTLKNSSDGVRITRADIDYKRYALTTQKVAAYESERNTVGSQIDGLQKQLGTAQQKASKAKTESEQLAALAEIQGINAQVRIMQLRLQMRQGDVETHAISVEDRERIEVQNLADARRSEALASLKLIEAREKRDAELTQRIETSVPPRY